jgi:hypothetical protein
MREPVMAIDSRRRSLVALVSVVLLVGCSAREQAAVRPVYASAAQRIELAPASAAPARAAAGTMSALSGSRLRPPAVEEIRLPDGTVGVKVAQQYFHTIIGCRQPDGTFSTHCPESSEARP